jgi:hypothetical protein
MHGWTAEGKSGDNKGQGGGVSLLSFSTFVLSGQNLLREKLVATI